MTLVRIVGAGLSGLAAAWRLTEAGYAVEMVEASHRAGGLIETIGTPHGRVESAANAFVWSAAVDQLFRSAGVAPRFASPAARRRFIFRDGRPRRWPLGPVETLTVAARAGRSRVAGCAAPAGCETVAHWADRVWGPVAARWLISPAVQGLYAAPAEQLAAAAIVQSAGTPMIARRRSSTIVAPAGGMGALMDGLSARLRERGVSITLGSRMTTLDPAVPTVVATSAAAAAPLVAPHAPRLGAALASVPMMTMAMATAFFRPHDRDIRGFGVLFPRGCGVQSLGVRFDSDIFPTPGISSCRTETWIMRVEGAPGELIDDSQIWRAASADRRTLTGRADEPESVVTTVRPGALPLYGPEVLTIRSLLDELPPWLALAGNYMGRLGASTLLEVAGDAASRVARFDQARNRRSASASPV